MDDFNALRIHTCNIIVYVKSDHEIFSKNEKKNRVMFLVFCDYQFNNTFMF